MVEEIGGKGTQEPDAPRLTSRLLQYIQKGGETRAVPVAQGLRNVEDLFPSPDGLFLEKMHWILPPRERAQKMLTELGNVVLLTDIPDTPHGRGAFAHDCVLNAGIQGHFEVRLSKRSDMVFIYDLSADDQLKLAQFMKENHPFVSTVPITGVAPHRFEEDITQMILSILENQNREEMSWEEISRYNHGGYLLLTEDAPYDTNRLVEFTRGAIRGIRLRPVLQIPPLDRRHKMALISVRRLAPLVHQMISPMPRELNKEFLISLERLIEIDARELHDAPAVAPGVAGEAVAKPLEHLVTCVPGVEVIWMHGRKVIRKLELPERAGGEPNARAPGPNVPPEGLRQEQDVVKLISDILKLPSNLYLTIRELEEKLRQCQNYRLERDLEEFITERPKHFQILGDADFEVVTLSHRAQIKRVCNDLQKVLRPRKPKCISSVEVARAFANHWQSADQERTNRRFNVEDFGVCYLDDLLVTIPQHWGVHCSEYVSTDGEVIRRQQGNGEEDIPDFVPDSRGRDRHVYAWIPRHHQTDVQKKSLALLKQQILNMFRGDPSAEMLLQHLLRHNRNHHPEHNRMFKLAALRANHNVATQGQGGRDNPTLPCGLELQERTFVPLYHRFCGEQVALVHFGVRDLFELFDSMQDTFVPSGNGQERTISLTSNARCEILERRVVDILRMEGRPMTEEEVLRCYRNQPTMAPYYVISDIKRALKESNLIHCIYDFGRGSVYHLRPRFSYSSAERINADIKHVLMIFMQSYEPLDSTTIGRKFFERTREHLEGDLLDQLENAGAIRRVDAYGLYDLHDVCRVVRNLVYKMNEQPKKIYVVEDQPYLGTIPLPNREVSVASLLSFTGDFTFIDPNTLLEIMCDFTICFERYNERKFRLRQELMIWVPAAEDTVPPPNRPHPNPRGTRRPGPGRGAPRNPPLDPYNPRGGHRHGGQ